MRKVPHVTFASNPARLRFFTQEIVLFREDLLKKMQRHSVVPPMVTATAASASLSASASAVRGSDLDNPHESDDNFNTKYHTQDHGEDHEELGHGDITAQLVQTILDQVQYSTVQYRTEQHSTVQYSTVTEQYSRVQYSTL